MADAHPQLEVGLLEVGPEPTTEPDLLKYFLNEDVLDGDFSKVPRSSPQDSPQDIFDSPETSPLPPLSSSSDMFLDPMFQTQLNGGLSYYDQATLFDNVILSVKDGNSLDLDDADMTGSKKRKIPNGITNLKAPLSPGARSLQSLGGSPPTDEERIQKRQKRLIKNRESAQLSRLRKKLYIEDLEKKVCTLTSENEALSKKIQTLGDELMYLRSTLKNSGANSALSASGAGGMLKKPALFNNKNGSAAGICLLIVLFSFGLVFNAQVREGGPMFPSSKRDPVPDVVPPSQRVLSSIKEDKTDGSASLRDLIDIFPSPQTHVKVGPSSAPLEKELDPAGKRTQPEPTFDRAMVKSDLVETGLPLKRIKTEPVDSDRGLVPIRITPSAASMTSKELSEQLSTEVRYPPDPGNALSIVQRHNSTSLQPRGPPTSYIYCSEAQEIVVTQGNANEPPTIALLLPAGVLNSTVIPHVDQDSDNTMVEVSCQVLNIHVWQVTTAPEPTRV